MCCSCQQPSVQCWMVFLLTLLDYHFLCLWRVRSFHLGQKTMRGGDKERNIMKLTYTVVTRIKSLTKIKIAINQLGRLLQPIPIHLPSVPTGQLPNFFSIFYINLFKKCLIYSLISLFCYLSYCIELCGVVSFLQKKIFLWQSDIS